MRCKYLIKTLAPQDDRKMHTVCYCNNPESKNYMRYSVDKCRVCSNCLDHSKRGEENE